MKFRYDINALRAIAVLSVLFFHFGVSRFEGGFSGVDVFFVISGYLMTRIISGSLQQHTFTLTDFYGKRIKRIIPALLVLVGILTVLTFFITFPVDYRETAKNSVSSLLFISNIVYWRNSNYFAPASDTNILLHTWSLSVEWQFYLIYPIILRWLHKVVTDSKKYLLVFVGLTALLTVGSFLFTQYDATASFYLLPSRAWEMMIGGIAFYLEGRIQDRKKRIPLALIGYAIILYSILFIKKGTAWPGVLTLLPVIGTFMVLIADWNELKPVRMGIIQFFGRISYSLYLWHWPVIVFATYFGIVRNKTTLLIFVAIAIGLAYLSYRFIETLHYKQNKRILFATAAMSAIILVCMMTDANSFLFKEKSQELAAYEQLHEDEKGAMFRQDTCFIMIGSGKKYNKEHCLCLSDTVKNVLLIGDSHAAQLWGALSDNLRHRGILLSQATGSSCVPVIRKNVPGHCDDVINYVYKDYIAQHAAEIDGVIITANWVNEVNNSQALMKDLQSTLQFLKEHHLNVMLIGQNETYTMSYPYIAAWESELERPLTRKFRTPQSEQINTFLKSSLPSLYVDVFNKDSVPAVSPANVPYMFDEHHVTPYGATLLVNRVFTDPIAVRFLQEVYNHKRS
ncbi:acyltransferase family protein [Chitinophaga rhizophila]|uniref:Acyltransferase n=1 Tax=Chitinophaga rhizophila TaxID=2866212 RepID=A0ABS7GI96_9BACT|nr:acyltransferase family protein [Chitinophaga rhizophila]MBW8687141.1 acyltransferase [Chitinophaga rhizophila]